jgi:hypothetical protein
MWWFGDTGLGLALHGPIQSDLVGAVRLGASYTNLRWLHVFKLQIQGGTLSCIWVNAVMWENLKYEIPLGILYGATTEYIINVETQSFKGM